MVERYRGAATAEATFAAPSARDNPFLDLTRKEITFLNSGCTLLNCIMGGGWPLGRVVNIVGDKSTGKTLLAEEAMANFLIEYPQGKIYYRESEAAFDESYAQELGLDTSKIDFGPEGPDTHWQTMEAIMDDVRRILDDFDRKVIEKVKALKEKQKKNKKFDAVATKKAVIKAMPPIMYTIDSLDALSCEAELGRDIHEGSYNLGKQKLLGELFRTEVGRMKRAKMLFIVISQIRDRIGAMIRGVKYTRAGGKALDFYASVVLFLADLGKVPETVKGIKRVVAIKVKVKASKNKITKPFGECQFELRFGYGIDDDWANLDYLKEVNRLKDGGFDSFPKNLKGIDLKKLQRDTIRVWQDVEKSFKPARGKYVKDAA